MWRKLCVVLTALVMLNLTQVAQAAGNLPANCIYINLASRMLSLYIDGNAVLQAPIGAGKVKTPSPQGSYQIIEMEEKPVWIDPDDKKKVVEGGEGNPLGLRWMRFDGNYGIHGTNNPDSIGGYVSNGCIRMYEEDVEEVYAKVDIGWPVVLVYERVEFEKLEDGTWGYRIYPDGYEWQKLTVKDVQQILAKHGLQATASAKDIGAKLEESDGSLSALQKVYRIELDGRWISGNAKEVDGVFYLPVYSISKALKIPYNWVRETEELTTARGTDISISVNDELLITQECAEKLFGVKGAFNEKEVFCLLTEKRRAELAAEAAAAAEAKAREEELARRQAYGTAAPKEAEAREKAAPTQSPAAVKQGKE